MYSKWTNVFLFFITLFVTGGLHGRLLAAPSDILKSHFPNNNNINIINVLLTKSEYEAVKNLAQRPFNDKVFRFYQVSLKNKTLAVAGLYTKKIRTKDETALFIIDNTGNLKAIEVVAFYEPPEYLPSNKWLRIFKGKNLSHSLKVKADVPKITGATLTANALAESARIILAVWKVKKSKLLGPQ